MAQKLLLKHKSAQEYFIQTAEGPIYACFQYFSKNQQENVVGHERYVPSEDCNLGEKLTFVLESIDSCLGSQVFKVEFALAFEKLYQNYY